MSKESDSLKLLWIGCGIVLVFAILGMSIGVIWAIQYQKRTGIDGGNAPAFFLIVGAVLGIFAAALYALFRKQKTI